MFDINSQTTDSLEKTQTNLNSITMNISRKRIYHDINLLDFIKLEKLDCSQNKIKNLDNILPGSLIDLDCSSNLLTVLDNLPIQLRILNCHHNMIRTLDNLPSELFKLDCSFNEIINLDNLPNQLKYLFCNNNYIQSLNCLPILLKYLYCHNNEPNIELENLPQLEKIIY